MSAACTTTPAAGRAQAAQQARDARLVRAYNIRIDAIDVEMVQLDELRQQFYTAADDVLNEIDQLTDQRFELVRCLWRVEVRLAQAAFKRRLNGAAA